MKSYLRKRKHPKTQDFAPVSVPNPMHDTRKFTALCYRTGKDLLEIKYYNLNSNMCLPSSHEQCVN